MLESGHPLRLTRYERASAALTSALAMLGIVTLLMLLVWLSGGVRLDRPPSQVVFAEPAKQPESPSLLPGGELQSPGAEELPEAGEPPPEIALEHVAPIVESEVVMLDALTIDDGDGDAGRKKGKEKGGTDGFGPLIGRGAWDRWEIRYSAVDMEEYKRQLDHFGIEFGVAGGGDPLVHYLKDFSADEPTKRTGDPKHEKRIRFLYAGGPLKRADRQIAQAAGIPIDGRIVFQFHTDETYRTLLKLEFEEMKPRGIRIGEVVRTVFGVRKTVGGYEFYVIRQDYRIRGFATPRPSFSACPPPRALIPASIG
jgi:hypothetical protein